jgi:integrase
MSPKTCTQQKWYLASLALTDAYTDFILSRQAMQCASTTLEFNKFTAGVFLNWVEQQSVTNPDQVDARLVRQYLAELAAKGKADRTLLVHARAIRTLLRFWYAEKYIPTPVTFAMPRMGKKRLLCLSAEELNKVVASSKNPRDKALLLFMADSGLRRAEIIALNWSDIDVISGQVRVNCGKRRKGTKCNHRSDYPSSAACLRSDPRKSLKRCACFSFEDRKKIHWHRYFIDLSPPIQKDRNPNNPSLSPTYFCHLVPSSWHGCATPSSHAWTRKSGYGPALHPTG